MKTTLFIKYSRLFRGLGMAFALLLLSGCPLESGNVGGPPQAGGDGTGIQGLRRFALQYDPTVPGGYRRALYRKQKSGNGIRGARVSAAFDYFVEDALGNPGELTPVDAADILTASAGRTFFGVVGSDAAYEQEREGVDPKDVTDPIVEACFFEGDPNLGQPTFVAAYIAQDTNGDVYPGSVVAEFPDQVAQTEPDQETEFTEPISVSVGDPTLVHTFETGGGNQLEVSLSGGECQISGQIPIVQGGTGFITLDITTTRNSTPRVPAPPP